ncbi:MAG: PfkB family carbohydrate kinase [Eubacterium sp.]|nr:PfkB family carbohydrate kinase [Eubacterium sp.]
MGKIVSKEEFKKEIRPALKKENKKIVLCHGVFDLIHLGHIIHFEQAKKMGDALVVSVTSEKFVRKGPGRPYFGDEMRMKFLEAIEYIDYVILSEGYTVDDIVEVVEPDIYVKGEEYKSAKEDITGKISEEQEVVERHGGRIRFTTGQVFSSTKLINKAMAGLSEDVINYMVDFKSRYSMTDVKHYAEKAEKLNVLVIGDMIVDRYTYCAVQGIMSKDMGYSARLVGTEDFFGGSAAVAKHLSDFAGSVTLMTVIGSEEDICLRMVDSFSGRVNFEPTFSAMIPTIVKCRYLTRDGKRDEYRKIFAVNNIPEKPGYEEKTRKVFLQKLEKSIESYDAVFLCDFGHGLIDRDVMELVQERAKYLVLNCQTNSANKGMNIITKYHRADVFALDQRELNLAYPSYDLEEKEKLERLAKHLNGNGWLTRGSMGAYDLSNGKDINECPAFTLSVKDTIGAGDAFFSLAGIFTAAGAPVEIGTFMGNIGGALEANIVGNKESVEKVNALKFAVTLLNV